MNKKYVIESFKNIQLFSSLTDEELHQISGEMVIKRFKKNETILYEEDTNEFMYIVLSGKVKAVQVSEDGKEIILAMHQAGDFFGEITLIDGKTVPATVIATEDSTAAIIYKKNFYSLLFIYKKVLENLLQILCSRLRESWDRIQLLNFKNASQRIKMLFMMLSDNYGQKTNEGIVLNIKLTHQNIADMAGITRETVTRIIDKWQRNGEITILKNKFICFSPDFLQKGLKM
ncbi:MAG: Crp/Fnr family transcriptional regulator [Nitrospirota bacterium]